MTRLPDLLLDAAERFPERRLVVHGGGALTFPELRDAAAHAAGGALQAGVRPGDAVVLAVDDIADFFVAFWGLLFAGATPVPVARARAVAAAALIGGPVVVDRGAPGGVDVATLRGGRRTDPLPSDAPALIQLSSGSTREPRGVVLSHANLLANVRQLAAALPVTADDVKLTWMPHFHDMGLIGCHLLPLALGIEQVRMDAAEAMRDPRRWLEAAAQHRATVLSTTSFALARAVDRADADLSAVRLIVNGAEPVSAAVCRAFSARAGLPEAVHFPLYGLAEASVGVSAPRSGGLRTTPVDGKAIVHLGPPLPDVDLRFVDGELQVRGPNVFAAYWRDPEATAAARDGDWVRTGDLGRLVEGELLITGRRKDVVIVNGRNLHAHDVEAAAELVPGVRRGGAVAVADRRGEVEGLAVAVLIEPGADAAPVLWAVRRAVAAETGAEPTEVLPLDALPRTTSGKKRRVEVRERLEAGGLDEAVGNTLGAVRAAVEAALGRRLGDAELDADLAALGVGSLAAVDAVNRLGHLGPDLRWLRGGGSVRGVARRIERSPPVESGRGAVRGEEVAIVAAACRLPGADTPESLWEAIRAGRVNLGLPVDGRFARTGGFLEAVDRFDAAGFGIDPREAAAMDPQQRLALTLAAEALARAGEPETREIGVYVGAGQQAYADVVRDAVDDDLPPGTLAGNLLSMLAARVSHQLDLRGPALTVDTACSAALVAVQLACRALASGECALALAGGVNLNLSPDLWRLFDRAGALSPTGRCLPFSPEADGAVPGEGGVLFVLQPLADALAESRPILGVIRGIAVNNDGASIGVMAPNPAGQEAVIRRALAAARVEAAEIRFVEAHGTGTRVGDAVERAVLDRVYAHGPAVGAVKANVGHLMGAAGAVGLLRLLGELDGNAPGGHALGAVSSFGFGGTNAHAIVAAPPPGSPRPREVAPIAGARHWLGEESAEGWVHAVDRDPGGGLVWSPLGPGGPAFPPGARLLVTGGTGGVGRALCRYLRRRYRAELVIVGSGPAAPHRAFLDAVGATYVQADVGDPGCASSLEGRFDAAFHLAGTLGPRAMEVKRGVAHLRGLDVGRWVLFSSISAVIPGLDRGIEGYARANAWLVAHAEAHPGTVAISWCPWEGEGMAAAFADGLRARGVAPIRPAVAMDALERALASGLSHVVVSRRAESPAAAAPLPDDLRGEVRALVARAAGREDFDDDATLGAIGVDSIEALELVKELERLVGRGLPTTLLYEHDTVRGIVRALEAGVAREAPAPAAPPPPTAPPSAAPAAEGVPLVPAQQTFVVQRAFFPDMPGNVLLAVTVDPPLDRDRLDRALAEVAARHPTLTAVIRGRQQVDGAATLAVRWVDRVDEAALADEVFDLAAGPLERVVTDGRRLVLDGHHAVIDAWSQKIVLEELLAAYEGAVLPAPRSTWADAAVALAATGGDAAPWRARLDGAPPLHLPWDSPVDTPAHGGCASVGRALPAEPLVERARAAGVSLPALLLAAWIDRLSAWSGQHDVVVRVAHHRREVRVPDVERIVGCFADSLPVRVLAGGDLEALARRVQAELAWAHAHAAASSVALAALGEHGPAGPVGLTPVGFSFLLLPAAERIGELTLSDSHGASGSGFTRLALVAWVFAGRLHLSLNAARSHTGAEKLAAMADDLERRLVSAEAVAPSTVHGRVLARCRQQPDRPAVGALTYRDLDRRSGAVAQAIDGPRIAVLAPPCPEAAVGILGVLRTGAAFVPLDPEWPDARVAQILASARPSGIVTLPDLAGRAAGFGLPVATVTDAEADGPDAPASIAYVMYTSGSTGAPKGVVVRHEAHLAWQDWVGRALGVRPEDRFAATSSLGYGGSLRQIFTPLLNGASCHPVPRSVARDPDALVAFLRDARITVWNSVPSLWAHLMDAAERAPGDPFATVRWVLIGGEAVPPALVRRWRARHGGRLVNLYGSTETIVNATAFEVVRDPGELHTPIGWPRAGVTVHLLDAEDGMGEICVGGAIADGYWEAPELTAAAFVDHPEHGRLYRTGDLGRRLPDGALVYVGRKDAQVQVHGNRVELGEIEHALAAHPDVAHAIVVHEGGWLVATVQPRPGRAPGDLKAWLAERLPSYMVPNRIEVVGEIPRNTAGKADRLALRTAARAVAPADPLTAPPADPLSARLAAAWAEVLELPALPGPDDDFFALGGDSIRALEVLDRLRPHLAGELRPMTLYRHRRLGDLAAALGEIAGAVVAPPAGGDGPYPLSSVQRGFVTAHQRRPEHPPTWCAAVPLDGPLDADALRQALDWLVARHEQLRTVFLPGPLQQALPPAPVALQYDDLSMLPEAVRERALEARWEEEGAVRFAPDRLPLFRARLCRLSPTRHALVLASHHAISDAWSFWVLARELRVAHDAFAAGGVPDLPPPRATFRDAVARERIVDDPWWRTALAGLSQVPAAPGETVSDRISLPPAALEALRARARAVAQSPYVLVLHALFAALAEVLDTDDLVVATALSGRDDEDLADVVGAFARGLPVRVVGPTLPRVAAAFEASTAHSDASAASIAAAAPIERLGRFFLSWLDPSAVPDAPSALSVDWRGGRFRFATTSTATELMVGALAHEGLHLNLHGGPLVRRVKPVLERRLSSVDAALIFYAPEGSPFPSPTVVERVDAALGSSELVLLPGSLSGDLEGSVRAACRVTDARVVSLAGMLPALTGLGTRALARPDQVLTTGHAATVVAMLLTVEKALGDRSWTDLSVGVLGYGSIGRAVLDLLIAVHGQPRDVRIEDPRHAGGRVLGADLILGASSGGATLDVDALPSGTIVVDDSFPRCFDDAAALRRMRTRADVLLVGGGTLDAGPLHRASPFAEAEAVRARYPSRWLPGCHAEALLIAAEPRLGPTVGPVTLERALAVRDAVSRAGWTAPPLHLGTWILPTR